MIITSDKEMRIPIPHLQIVTVMRLPSFKLTGLTRKHYTTLVVAKKKNTISKMMENANRYLELAAV